MRLIPSSYMALVVFAVIAGVAIGLGMYTFVYAKGYSYLTNDPNACANCHVMQGHFDSWVKSSHHNVASCNDCHTPHNGLIPKYASKAYNGFFHGLAFTTGDYPNPIRIKPINHDIAEDSCISCHQAIVASITPPHQEKLSCTTCHSDVGHALR